MASKIKADFVETVAIKQPELLGVKQPIKLGGSALDGSDATIEIDADGKLTTKSITLKSADGTKTSDLTLGDDDVIYTTKPFYDGTSNVYGLIYNQTLDLYKRFGTGTSEDDMWLSVVAERLNENSNSDPVTTYFNRPTTVQGNMKRVVVNSTNAEVKDYNANAYTHADQTGLLATEQVMVKIPKFHYISVEFVSGGNTYNIYAQSLNSFSIDLADFGFSDATSIAGQKVNIYESYGTIVGTVITSVVHSAFKHLDGNDRSYCYYGAFTAVSGRSTCTTTGTSTPVKSTANITFPTARTQATGFGSGFGIHSIFMRDALQITALIERGSFRFENAGVGLATKWEAYSWNTGASSDNQNNGLTLPLMNQTGVIRDASNRTIANSYRGIENYTGHLWQMCDGVNSISGVLWMAVWGATYASDTTAAPYFNSGITTLTNMSASFITSQFPGTFIPETVGGSSTTKMTDAAWSATGNTALYVGGLLSTPSASGLSAWASSTASSWSYWYIGSRSASLSVS